jgi:hypothetical protein
MAEKNIPPRQPIRDIAENWKNNHVVRRGNGILSPRAIDPCVIMNEYCYLWLNRDGSATTLTRPFYDYMLGEEQTTEQRRELLNRYLGMMTELYRSDRSLAGVMHFAALLASDPEHAATCDNFADIESLTLDPYFLKYAKDAFSPIGLMVDLWEPELQPGTPLDVPLNLINDLPEDWAGPVRVSLLKGDQVLDRAEVRMSVPTLGRTTAAVQLQTPRQPGDYEVIAELAAPDRTVTSRRHIEVVE